MVNGHSGWLWLTSLLLRNSTIIGSIFAHIKTMKLCLVQNIELVWWLSFCLIKLWLIQKELRAAKKYMLLQQENQVQRDFMQHWTYSRCPLSRYFYFQRNKTETWASKWEIFSISIFLYHFHVDVLGWCKCNCSLGLNFESL